MLNFQPEINVGKSKNNKQLITYNLIK